MRQIVLSDIKMRGMDGIEMCRQLRSLLPDCQIIFVSSYSYKEYLKAAIELGAIQYVEKPVVLEELIGAVEKGIERIAQIKKQKALQDSYTESMDFLKREALFSLLSTPEDVKKLECQLRRSGLWDSGDTRMRIGIVKLAGTVDDTGEFVRFYREKLQIFMAEEQFYCNMDFHDNRTLILLATGTKSMLDRDGELIRALCVLAVESKGEYRHFLAVGAMVEEPGPPASRQDAFPIRALPPLHFVGKRRPIGILRWERNRRRPLWARFPGGRRRKPSVFWSRFMHSL